MKKGAFNKENLKNRRKFKNDIDLLESTLKTYTKQDVLSFKEGDSIHYSVNAKVEDIDTIAGVTTMELSFDEMKDNEEYMKYSIAIVENDFMIVDSETAEIISELYTDFEKLVFNNKNILNYSKRSF